MSSHLKHSFTPEELETLDRAYTTAWAVLVSSEMYARWQRQEALKQALRKRILAFAAQGVSDPGGLTEATLRNFGLR